MAGNGRAGIVGSIRDVGGISGTMADPGRVSIGRSGAAGARTPDDFFSAPETAGALGSGTLGSDGSAGLISVAGVFASVAGGFTFPVGGLERAEGFAGTNGKTAPGSGTFGSGSSPGFAVVTGADGPLASAGASPASAFSAVNAASAAVMGASSDVPSGSMAGGGSGRGRGCNGGVARSLTASCCEAEGVRAPVKGGAGRRIALDWDGSGDTGAGEAVDVGPGTFARSVAAGRSGMTGKGVVAAAGAIEEVDFLSGAGAAARGAGLISSGRAGWLVAGDSARLISSGRGSDPVAGLGARGGTVALGRADAFGWATLGPGGIKIGADFRVSGAAAAAGGAGVRRNEAVRGRTLLTGGSEAVGESEEAGAAGMAAGAVAGGMNTGADLRVNGGSGAVGAGVRRSDAVGGRTRPVAGLGGSASVDPPKAGGRGPVSALVAGFGWGSGSVAWPEEEAGRIWEVGGLVAPGNAGASDRVKGIEG
jgi:hypothetical protein